MTGEIKPSIIESYHTMYNQLTSIGLSRKDIIKLIQIRTRPKQSLSDIDTTLKAIEILSGDLDKK